MASVIYQAICSLDGYINDAQGGFDWAMPSEEVHEAINDDFEGVGTYLYGRRMYEVMSFWEAPPPRTVDSPAAQRWAGIWQRADKVVCSRTLERVTTARTRIERDLTPEVVARAQQEADGDLAVAGPTLAARALELGLVDTIDLVICPTVVGGGTPVFQGPGGVTRQWSLARERRFANGMVQLTYECGGTR